MKKLDNYSNCLEVLKSADFNLAKDDAIYRMGVIGQFNLTFELAWKALQAVLRLHGVETSETGSPREILKLGVKVNFVENETAWLAMLGRRNTAVHVYDEAAANELILLIKDSFIPAFVSLEKKLMEKVKEAEENS